MSDPHDNPAERRIAEIVEHLRQRGFRLELHMPDDEPTCWHAVAMPEGRHTAQVAVGATRLEAAEAALTHFESNP